MQFTKHFQHCQEKVEAGEGFKGEDCVEEMRVYDDAFFIDLLNVLFLP